MDHPMHPPGQDPPSLRRARILRERAERLAREEPPAPEGALLDVVAFPLGGEPFAVGALHVGEVLPLRGVTPLPGTPPFVAGILNLRGTLVSLVDLRVLLHMPREEEVAVYSQVEMARKFAAVLDAITGKGDAAWVPRALP